MNQKERDIIDGLILSDAHLRKPSKNSSVHMSLTLKYLDFAKGIQQNLPSLPWGKDSSYKYLDKRTGNEYTQNQIRTKVSKYLNSIYPSWYAENKKIVPKNLKINPTVLLWWYLGDGSLLKKKIRPKYRRIGLATQSFTRNEVNILIDKLKKLLSSEYVYPESGSIIISRTGICSFAQKVGVVSPVECYDYKFDFGQYLNEDYKVESYKNRPLVYINEFRKKNKVRELNYIDENTILLKEKSNEC